MIIILLVLFVFIILSSSCCFSLTIGGGTGFWILQNDAGNNEKAILEAKKTKLQNIQKANENALAIIQIQKNKEAKLLELLKNALLTMENDMKSDNTDILAAHQKQIQILKTEQEQLSLQKSQINTYLETLSLSSYNKPLVHAFIIKGIADGTISPSRISESTKLQTFIHSITVPPPNGHIDGISSLDDVDFDDLDDVPPPSGGDSDLNDLVFVKFNNASQVFLDENIDFSQGDDGVKTGYIKNGSKYMTNNTGKNILMQRDPELWVIHDHGGISSDKLFLSIDKKDEENYLILKLKPYDKDDLTQQWVFNDGRITSKYPIDGTTFVIKASIPVSIQTKDTADNARFPNMYTFEFIKE